MRELEMAVKALTRCVSPEAFSAAMAAVRAEEGEAGEAMARCDHTEAEIRRILKELGIPSHIHGHSYIVTAMKLLIEEPALRHEITKRLYPLVAEVHDTTCPRVERSVRHAIEAAWSRGDLDVQHQYFGNTVSPVKGKPTNAEFLCTVSDAVRLR